MRYVFDVQGVVQRQQDAKLEFHGRLSTTPMLPSRS